MQMAKTRCPTLKVPKMDRWICSGRKHAISHILDIVYGKRLVYQVAYYRPSY